MKCIATLALLLSLFSQISVVKSRPIRQSSAPSSAPTKSAEEYYKNIHPRAKDDVLKKQLFSLVNPHTVYSYDEIWSLFSIVYVNLDTYPCDDNLTHIPDVYSAYCWEPVQEEGGECGNYKHEGDCFNREHIWPKSWFGGFDYGQNAQTDLYELYPSDGYVNGLRGNYPLGNVDPATISYNSTNGSLIGSCASNIENYVGKCFETADMYKGDIARSYFYLSVAYWNQWDCCDDVGVNGSSIKPWMEQELRAWHVADPVDEPERRKNEAIFALQNNRCVK